MSHHSARLSELDDGRAYYGGRDATNRIVALVGGLEEAILLAQSLARQSGHMVLVLDVVDTGDENSTIDPSDPFHEISDLGDGVDRLNTPVELSSGDFSEVVSRLLLRYDHLLVRVPEERAATIWSIPSTCAISSSPLAPAPGIGLPPALPAPPARRRVRFGRWAPKPRPATTRRG